MFSIQHCSVAAIAWPAFMEIIVIAVRNHNQAIRFGKYRATQSGYFGVPNRRRSCGAKVKFCGEPLF
jgi:hypothetical protein